MRLAIARWTPVPDTWPDAHGATVPGYPSLVVRRMRELSASSRRSQRRSAPAVGGPGGPDQHVAQFAQFGCPGAFVERGGDILRRASHLVNAIRQVGGLVGRQHHRVGGQAAPRRPG